MMLQLDCLFANVAIVDYDVSVDVMTLIFSVPPTLVDVATLELCHDTLHMMSRH